MIKKFLVLGSNSFSGSNFINYILHKKCKVIGVSRSKEYSKIYLPYKYSTNKKNFKFFQINIDKNIKKLKLIVRNFKPHYVVNYIAQGMVAESWINPEDWYKTNVVSQVNLYKELSKFKFIKKFIHVTTPEVYGSTKLKLKENFNFNPSTPYAISRATTDLHLKKYFLNFNLPLIFTRTSNIYGPHQQLYRIVPKALLFAKLNKKIELHGGGNSKRSFIYADDASSATYKISLNGKLGETYHISTNRIISISNMVKKIAKLSKIKFTNLVKVSKDRIGKDSTYNLSSSKIRKNLFWQETVNLDEGLNKTLSWINKNYKILKKEKHYYTHKK
jgi:dTDP-glucose 4,6-dehydratase